jgi:type IV pilus assembly protein PilC
MPVYTYEGILNGKKIKGKLKAKNKGQALELLEAKGIIPLAVEEFKERKRLLEELPFKKRVPLEDIAFSLLQLSTLLEAGIPLTRALELVASQVENETLSTAYLKIKKDIEEGLPPGEAFRNAAIFPDFLPEMLEGAHRGENLEHIFRIAGEYLENLAEIRSKIFSSVSYPSFVIVSSFLAVIVAVKFVVPKLLSILESFGKEPPLVTKLIIYATDLMLYTLAVAPFLLVYLLLRGKKIFSSPRFGEFLLKIPVIGKLVLYTNLARFAKVLAMLLEASVPLPEALRLAIKSISLPPLREALKVIPQEVEKGKSLSQLLRKVRYIPPLFVNLVETGEAGGELERMLSLLAQTYEKETLRTVDFWVRMIEPISILLIAVVVGVVVLSVMLPLSELSAGVH